MDQRFGQIGHMTVTLETPLRINAGRFHQQLTWHNSGQWTLYEEIAYRGRAGDISEIGSNGDPSHLAPQYAELLVRLHEASGLALFIDELPEGVTHDCGASRTAITFSLFDAARGEAKEWQQCVDGSLSTMSERGAGPQLTATRLVAAGIQVRDATVGGDYRSPYYGSIPFGPLAKGERSSVVERDFSLIDDQGSWKHFWRRYDEHNPLPEVNFEEDYVIVAFVGQRNEAGQSVNVRNIFQTVEGTVANIVERVPGDFCSPAQTIVHPFHIVVAPRTPAPHQFILLQTEYVSCGP